MLLYDGDCGVCSLIVRFLASPSIEMRPFQRCSDDVLANMHLSRARCAGAVQLVSGDVVVSGALAMNAVVAAKWPRVDPLRRALERSRLVVLVESAVYALFARHRAAVSRALGRASCTLSGPR